MNDSRAASAAPPLSWRAWLVLAVALPIYAGLARAFWFVTDDAYISFRYARNLARGLGLRYNLADEPPVEGYSNLLWTLVCAAFEWARADVALWAPLISACCGAALVTLVWRSAWRELQFGLVATSAATLLVATFPGVAIYASSGLETMPFALALFVAADHLLLRRSGPAALPAGVALACAALLRPEGVLWGAGLVTLACWRWPLNDRRPRNALLLAAGWLVVAFAGQLVFRLAYHQAWAPNTVAAKVSVSPATLERGLDYLMTNALTTLSPFAALLATPTLFLRRWRPYAPALCVLVFAAPAYAVGVGGDFMTMGRFLVPGWPFAALAIALSLDSLARTRPGLVIAASLAACLLGLHGAALLDRPIVPRSVMEKFRFRFTNEDYRSEIAQWRFQRDNARAWLAQGATLTEVAPAGASVVCGAIGAIGYASDLHVFDQYGLVSREVALREPDSGSDQASPGHDKGVDIAFFLPQRPTFLALATMRAGRAPTERQAFAAGVEQYRRAIALTTPGVMDDYVVDFHAIPPAPGVAPDSVLVFWRRTAPGAAGAEWLRFHQRMQAIVRGENDP